MASKSIFDRYFYHGSPVCIEKFSYEFTGNGTDELGSGFYFVNVREKAIRHTEINESNGKTIQVASAPTLHKVKLSPQNPISSTAIRALTEYEVEQLITSSPIYKERLEDFGDVEQLGVKKVLKDAVRGFAGNDEAPLILTLNDLSGDFYGKDVETFNRAARTVLGYDGVFREYAPNAWIVCAWFPEQIDIVSRIKVNSPENTPTGPGR
jgi:hypothetical protein